MEREWRDIAGYEGHYQVSNIGEVRSLNRVILTSDGKLRRIKGKILKPILIKRYLSVHLVTNTLDKTLRIHRLVATAFHANLENKPQVNHLDGNKLNNRADNLGWSTARENILHAVKLGLIIPPTNLPKPSVESNVLKAVANCRNEIFDSVSEAARQCNIKSKRDISRSCSSPYKTAGKYPDGSKIKWSYYLK